MVSINGSKRSVKLTFNHGTNGPVYAAGTFNNWNTTDTPMKSMKSTREGSWEATLKLPAGEYQFRYYSEGQWFTDFAAGGIVPNGFGEFNSVLIVPEGASTAPAAARATRPVRSRV